MGDDGWSPHCSGWTGPGRGGVTCSYVGPSAGGASPGAGPGSSHRRLWGQGLAPEPPAAPGSVSLGTGYRSAPLPGWTGTVGGETQALVGRIWKTDLTRKASPPPAPSWGSGILTGRLLCQTGQSSGERPAGPGSAEMGSIWGVPSAPPGPQPRTVLLRSIRCLCTHCIFLSRARFSGSTTPAKPRFSSAYSWPKDGHGGRDTGQSEMGYGQEKSSHPHADGYITTEEEGQCFQKKPNHKEPLL